MTPEQFDALATLLRLRQGNQQEAARLVLVQGMRQVDAARQLGISTAALGATMRACRRGVALAGIICGMPRQVPQELAGAEAQRERLQGGKHPL